MILLLIITYLLTRGYKVMLYDVKLILMYHIMELNIILIRCNW